MKLLIIVVSVISLAACRSLDWRMAGGEKAEEGQFPYMVSLRHATGRHSCGGSIIDKRWILTAAHCITTRPAENMTIMAGSTKLYEGGVLYKAEKAIMHDKVWDSVNFTNDVGLIKLTEDIEFNDKIQPIALSENRIGVGVYVTLSGWGKTEEEGTSSEDLNFLALKTIPQDVCQEMFDHTVQDHMICTFNGIGEGSCKGDSGSPLVIDGRVSSITSWGSGCGMGYPSVSTRVDSFVDWIRKTIAENS